MAITINHQTNDISVTSGSLTIDGSAPQTVQVYSAISDLPSASSNHGMVAHVHGEGAMYFAHGGNWYKIANATAATTSADGLMSAADKTKLDAVEASADVTDTTNVVAALTAGTNITIAADGTISSTASGGGSGIALTDLSVTQNSASGSGALSYDNTSGVFSYTPPASSGGGGGSSTSALTETEFTATAGQTVFTVSSGITNADNVAVFLNGSMLGSTDVTVSDSANTATLASGATVGDLVTVAEYGSSGGVTTGKAIAMAIVFGG